MGILNYIGKKAAKSEAESIIKALNNFKPEDDISIIKNDVLKMISKLHITFNCKGLEDIIFTNIAYNPAYQWSECLSKIAVLKVKSVNEPYVNRLITIINIFVRGVVKLGLENDVEQMNYAKVIWYKLTNGNIEEIPDRFK